MRPTLLREESPAGRWELAVGAPAPALAGAVARYVGYREQTREPLRRRELPLSEAQLVVSFGPQIRITGTAVSGRSFAVGVGERAALIEHDGEQHGVGIVLRPTAVRTVIGVPPDELSQSLVTLEEVLGPLGNELEERLATAPGWDERFALLDGLLHRRIADASTAPAPVVWAWRELVRSGGQVRVEDLARDIGWSRRHLAARFAEHVGHPPKRFARLLRFRRAVNRLTRDREPSLAQIALEAGYYDQAHFNRDIRDFAGVSPTELLARRLPAELGFAA